MDKKNSRQRRAKRTRMKIRELGMPRLTVTRSPRHIYAQLFTADGSKVLAEANTLQKTIANDLKATGNVAAAVAVGKKIAELAKAAGVEKVAFDRAGYRYHGRVKALADGAREGGLQF